MLPERNRDKYRENSAERQMKIGKFFAELKKSFRRKKICKAEKIITNSNTAILSLYRVTAFTTTLASINERNYVSANEMTFFSDSTDYLIRRIYQHDPIAFWFLIYSLWYLAISFTPGPNVSPFLTFPVYKTIDSDNEDLLGYKMSSPESPKNLFPFANSSDHVKKGNRLLLSSHSFFDLGFDLSWMLSFDLKYSCTRYRKLSHLRSMLFACFNFNGETDVSNDVLKHRALTIVSHLRNLLNFVSQQKRNAHKIGSKQSFKIV